MHARHGISWLVLGILAVQTISFLPAQPASAARSGVAVRTADTSGVTGASTEYGALPLGFERNLGQADPSVAYVAHGHGYSVYLTGSQAMVALAPVPIATAPLTGTVASSTGMTAPVTTATEGPATTAALLGTAGISGTTPLSPTALPATATDAAPPVASVLPTPASSVATGTAGTSANPAASASPSPIATAGATATASAAPATISLSLAGGSAQAAPVAQDPLPGVANYFIGSDHSTWITNIPTFGGVAYQGVYPGVDMVFHGKQTQIEYDFTVQPGADPSAIRLQVTGAGRVAQGGQGSVTVTDGSATLTSEQPGVYQVIGGQKEPVSGQYQVQADGSVGFSLGSYDHSQPLTIDPVLSYGTYLGGNGVDDGYGIAVDGAGNAYVDGTTYSSNFPGPAGGTGHLGAGGAADAFVSKLNAAGNALVYSDYIGGSNSDVATGIAVDSSGNAYVGGYTGSPSFPGPGGLATKLGPGTTSPSNNDLFVVKVNAAGSALLNGTVIGGTGTDLTTAGSLAIDQYGHAFVVATTQSGDFPGVSGGAPTKLGPGTPSSSKDEVAVIQVNLAGTGLNNSTLIGGTTKDDGAAIAVDGSGNAVVTGFTESANFPGISGSPVHLGPGTPSASNDDAFVIRLNSNGSALTASTVLGGTGNDEAHGLALDGSGNAYVVGDTQSTDLPGASGTAPKLGPAAKGWFGDAFVSKVNVAGTAVSYGLYLGGSNLEHGTGIAVDPAGNAYVTGETLSSDFYTFNALQPTYGGGGEDAWVTAINASGSTASWSTFLGGSDVDAGRGVALDGLGNVYVTGSTASSNFPTSNSVQASFGGSKDAFIAKIGTGPSAPGSGNSPWQESTNLGLGAGMTLGVNSFDGNVLLTVPGLHLPGVNGLDQVVSMRYNSLSHAASGAVAPGWLMGTGQGVRLVVTPSSATFYDESGFSYIFNQPSACTFTPPPGIDATLACAGSTYTLTFNASGLQGQFNSAGYLTAALNRQGNQISFGYDASGTQATSILNTEGQSTALTYGSPAHQLSNILDPAGRNWQYAHDSAGNLSGITDPNSGVTQFGYDAARNLTSITDAKGNLTLISYNAGSTVHQIVEVTDTVHNTGPTYTFTYGTGTQVQGPTGHVTTFAYDGSGRLTTITDTDSHVTTYGWTTDNQVASMEKPSTATTTYSYDSLNNLTQVLLPTGAKTAWQYTNAVFPHSPSTMTDTQGNVTTYGYNSQGLVNQVTDAGTHLSTYTFNANGTPASVSDPNGHVTSYGYNSQGLVSSVTPPAPLGTSSYTYNSKDLVATATDGKSQLSTYTYDALGRLTNVAYAGGSSLGYGYDADSNRTTMADSTGSTTYAFNALNQLTLQTLPGPVTDAYTWDGVGNLLTKADAGGTTTYGYDHEDLVTSVTDPASQQTTLGYDQDGNRTRVSYPNTVVQALTYDTAGELTTIAATSGSTTLTSFAYGYVNPATGKQTTLRYSLTDAASTVTSYAFDGLDRLTSAVQKSSGGSVLASYGYVNDNAGNLTQVTRNGTPITMTYNSANELTAAGSTTYSYDANGNLTGSSAGMSATYNGQDQMSSITPAGGSAISQGYSGFGQFERISAGTGSYRYDVTGLSAMPSGSTYFVRTPDGQLLSERTAAGTYYYLTDALGSVRALTNSTGAVVNTYAYDPYGATTASSGSTANVFGYGGQQLDSGTGLYKMGQRYYDPVLARWSAQDLFAGGLSNPQSFNRYSSVLGNPISLLDATGLDCNAFCGLGGAFHQSLEAVEGFVWHCGPVTTFVATTALVGGAASYFAAPFTLGASAIASTAATLGGAAQLAGCALGIS